LNDFFEQSVSQKTPNFCRFYNKMMFEIFQ